MKAILLTSLFATLLAAAPHALSGEHDHHAPAKPTVTGKADDPAFTKLDTNKDGFISKSVLPAKHPLLPHFGMVDKNKDGKLDKKEFESARNML